MDQRLARAILRFENELTSELAAEVVGAAIVAGDKLLAKPAAEFLVACGNRASMASKDLARKVLGENVAVKSLPSLRSQIAHLKYKVRNDPRNTLAWVDLARGYATLGQMQKATHAIEIGLWLAPENRFVLRSASRFFCMPTNLTAPCRHFLTLVPPDLTHGCSRRKP